MQKYRRKSDGVIVDAFQYGEGQPWNKEAISKVAAFVTGVDVNTRTGVLNESILDVVRPILSDWNATLGKTPIEIATPLANNGMVRAELGDWIIRTEVSRSIVREGVFYDEYELVHETLLGRYMSDKEIEIKELVDFLYNECFTDFRSGTSHEMAEKVAPMIVNAGWRKDRS